MKKFEILEHTADLKIRIYGQNLAELFINAGLALASQQTGNKFLGIDQGEIWEEVELDSGDLNSLLVDWLNELLSRSDINKKVYSDFQIKKISEKSLRAKIRGALLEKKEIEIKGATYHGLEIIQRDNQWQAIVIFDI